MAFERVASRIRKSTLLSLGAADKPEQVNKAFRPLIFKEAVEGSAAVIFPLKDARLNELVRAGFNCPRFRSWPRGKLDLQELREFRELLRVARQGISLRNFREEKILEPTPMLPVAYDQTDWAFIEKFCTEHNRNFHTLVNEGLPLNDSEFAGKILLRSDETYTVSCFEGYGTPRFVDDGTAKSVKVYHQKFGLRPPEGIPESVEALVLRLKSFRENFRPMIIEFSVYPYDVGIQKQKTILWEWRSGRATS